jgi:hypothetical protein
MLCLSSTYVPRYGFRHVKNCSPDDGRCHKILLFSNTLLPRDGCHQMAAPLTLCSLLFIFETHSVSKEIHWASNISCHAVSEHLHNRGMFLFPSTSSAGSICDCNVGTVSICVQACSSWLLRHVSHVSRLLRLLKLPFAREDDLGQSVCLAFGHRSTSDRATRSFYL